MVMVIDLQVCECFRRYLVSTDSSRHSVISFFFDGHPLYPDIGLVLCNGLN